uniref:LEM domain-containing protein n=1 Tax=Syphacia muris TaxID=451379 RepID=A0A0N5AY38_9BILA
MSDPAALSDAELRNELIALGANVGPITATTRSLYEKQLEKRRAAASGTVAPPVTKTRSASKSPSRVSKKTVTTSTVEIVQKRTSDRNGPKVNPSELTDDIVRNSVKEFRNGEGVGNADLPQDTSPSKVLRSREIGIFQSSPTKQTRVSTIYPGLSTPRSLNNPTASKIAERVPTPPRVTRLTDRSSFLPGSAKTSYNTSGVFSDITADFANQLGKRTNYSYMPSERFTNSSFLRSRAVNNDDEEQDDEEEDDHMESSRIIYPSENKYTNAYRTNVTKVPAYSSGRRSGFDISNMLLLFVICTLLLLFAGYFGVIHSEKVIAASLATAELTKATFSLLYTYAVLPIIVAASVCGAGTLLYILNKRLLSAKAARRKRVFDLVEKITDIIRESAANGQGYIAEPHVRDMLIPPSERAKGSAEWRRWQEAIRFINENDSRISTENRVINGVECAVWRWVPANKLGWQGNAFDGKSQLNVPDHALTHCLKLRGLFSSAKSVDGADVERSLLQKLSPIKPLHVKVECGSKDGVVFVRFASLNDCKTAFTALHGSWFNGQLVSAKYLRDERYEQRFPNAARNSRR